MSGCRNFKQIFRRRVAQLVEQRSPKPSVAGSNPAAPATPTSKVASQLPSGQVLLRIDRTKREQGRVTVKFARYFWGKTVGILGVTDFSPGRSASVYVARGFVQRRAKHGSPRFLLGALPCKTSLCGRRGVAIFCV